MMEPHEEPKAETVAGDNAPDVCELKPQEEKPVAGDKPKKKRRLFRVLKWGAIILVVLIVALFFLRDILIRKAIVEIGTMATGTRVEIGSFSTSLLGGAVTIKDMLVANPPDYQLPDAFKLGEVHVRIEPGSLLSHKIVVNEVIVRGMKIDFEQNLDGTSNLTDIQKNIEKFAGLDHKEDDGTAPASAEEKTQKAASGKQLVIRLFEISDSGVAISSKLLGTSLNMALPDITLRDIGDGKPLGETLRDLYAEVLAAIVKGMGAIGLSSENFKALGDSLTQTGNDALKSLSEGGSAALKSLSEGGGSAGEEIKKGIGEIKNLFK